MNEETNTSISAEAPTMSRFEELKALVAAAEADFNKFYAEGNKAAGTRVRAAMQELKNLCQTIRTEVQTIKNEGGKPGESGEPS